MAGKLRLLIVGFDAATHSLARGWMDEGHLPNLDGIRREGAFGLLRSTPNMHSAAAWSSIITGLNPGRHGIFNFTLRRFSDNRQMFYNGGDRHGPILPQLLNGRGMTMGMVNVPMTYPVVPVDGFMISGLDAPSLDERAFHPRGLRQEVMERFPGYASVPEGISHHLRKNDLEGAARAWRDLIGTRTELCLYLLREHPVDAFMVTYTASDWVGHYFWRFTDPDHPDHDRGLARTYLNTIREFYALLDTALGKLMKRLADDGHVMVVSDHGMGPHSHAQFHVARHLQDQGIMVRQGGSGPSFRNGLRRAASALPGALGRKARTFVDKVTKSDRDEWYEGMDWPRTRAYTEVGRKWVNLNIKGRNPMGAVDPEDRERFTGELKEVLLSWKDEATGRPYIKDVKTREEMYRGPYTTLANDMLIFPDPSVYNKDRLPESIRKRGFWWSGEHVDEGVVFIKGPSIKGGVRPRRPIVYDVVPTASFLCGAGTIPGLDGRVLEEVLTGPARSALKKAGGAGGGPAADGPGGPGDDWEDGEGEDLEEDDEARVRERLEGLGYL